MDDVGTKDETPPPKSDDANTPENKEEDARIEDTVGANTNGKQLSSPKQSNDTNMNDTVPSMESGEKDKPAEPAEAVRDHGDNGEEVVEGEEDTVIY